MIFEEENSDEEENTRHKILTRNKILRFTSKFHHNYAKGLTEFDDKSKKTHYIFKIFYTTIFAFFFFEILFCPHEAKFFVLQEFIKV